MHNLASSYSALGRHEEALAIRERVLEFMIRVLPENHTDIGEGRVRSGGACGVLSVRGWGLLTVTCRLGHAQSCHFVLRSREARGSACDGGKGAGVHASCAALEPSRHR